MPQFAHDEFFQRIDRRLVGTVFQQRNMGVLKQREIVLRQHLKPGWDHRARQNRQTHAGMHRRRGAGIAGAGKHLARSR